MPRFVMKLGKLADSPDSAQKVTNIPNLEATKKAGQQSGLIVSLLHNTGLIPKQLYT